jgi:hypothetical protein
MNRRGFLRIVGATGAAALAVSCNRLNSVVGTLSNPTNLIRFPEKTEMILLTDRPPQLETPIHYFRQDLTPNEAFFVRWHLEAIPTSVDLRTFRLNAIRDHQSTHCPRDDRPGRSQGQDVRFKCGDANRSPALHRGPPNGNRHDQ